MRQVASGQRLSRLFRFFLLSFVYDGPGGPRAAGAWSDEGQAGSVRWEHREPVLRVCGLHDEWEWSMGIGVYR